MSTTPEPRLTILDGPHYTRDDQGWEHHSYRLRLTFQGRQLTSNWRQGLGITDDPDPFDLISSLLLDSSYAESSGVWDFAADSGFEVDDEESYQHAAAMLAACEKAGNDLRRVFGDLDALAKHGTDPSELLAAWPTIVRELS